MIGAESSRAPCVLKAGGSELRPGASLAALVRLVGELRRTGRPVVLVHGGGEEVTDRAEALGLQSSRDRGQRVTSAPMLEVVLEVLGGRVNGRIVAALGAASIPALGLSGASERMLLVTPAGEPAGSLGWVGVVRSVQVAPLLRCTDAGVVPVVAPIGVDRAGHLFNVNADLAAGAIAAALRAELWLVSDVPAVRDADRRPLASLTPVSARALIRSGAANDGMIPKLEAAELALRGASRAWIGALESLTPSGPVPGAGTWFLSDARAPAVAPLARVRAGRRRH
ncbi:MAG: acetylglutamate kinase [Thermoplasmata archaeon]|nr:acetylglutamate kinase [Thermoplasmata archaeon]